MTSIRVTHPTKASPQAVWALMADFANIDVFNPHLKDSFLLEGSPENGLGCERQCDMKDGKNYIREKVIDWQEGRSYTVEITEGTLPVDNLVTSLGLAPQGTGALLWMETRYNPRWGFVGKAIDALILRRMMRGMLLKLLVGLDEKASLPLAQAA